MGILNALSTAVTGLSAQSTALDNISGNIANSQTIGFKRVDTDFVDLIPELPLRHEIAGSVVAYSQLTNSLQGSLKTTNIPTNIAISGDGFFTVSANTGTKATPVFGDQNYYTRRGDFTTDASNYLVNGAGKYLVGAAPGQVAGPIKIPTTPVAAHQTGTINYQGNLPSYPKTANADPATPGSELLPSSLSGATIGGSDTAGFLKNTIAGGEVTVYDAAGAPVTLQTRWGKTASSSTGGTDTWQAYYLVDPSATGTATAYAQIGSFQFTSNGALSSSGSATVTGLKVNGTTVGDVAFDFGSGNLTQYGDPNGQISNANLTQDGYATGSLNAISITSDGRVTGAYSNGQIVSLAQIQVAHFNGENSLKREDGSTYSQTAESGPPSYGLQGASLTGGAVETSNTDISDEFSKLIVTQQAYSANTRVLTTAQQMLQDVINVIR